MRRAPTQDPAPAPSPALTLAASPLSTVVASALSADDPPRPLLLDVTPAALRVATAGGFTDCILDRNAPIPIERTKRFTTAHHNQKRVVIECCRGEASRLDQNEVLGTLVLDELPHAPRGHIQIDVTFRVDADGILHVRARDVRTGKQQVASLHVLGAPVPVPGPGDGGGTELHQGGS
jgi:molecular chaperone DnaK